jgi:hypothetical protein
VPIEKVTVKILLGSVKWREGFMYLPIDVGMQCHQVFVLCPTFRHREPAIYLEIPSKGGTCRYCYKPLSESFLMSKGGVSAQV